MDGWGDFGKIVEYDATGIEKTSTSSDVKEVSRYSVNGQRLSAPAKGVNILKYSDGSVKKVAAQQYSLGDVSNRILKIIDVYVDQLSVQYRFAWCIR